MTPPTYAITDDDAAYVPPGWQPLIDGLAARGRSVLAKQERGQLVVMAPGVDPEMVAAVEEEAGRTCEECARPGFLHISKTGWLRVLCADHRSSWSTT